MAHDVVDSKGKATYRGSSKTISKKAKKSNYSRSDYSREESAYDAVVERKKRMLEADKKSELLINQIPTGNSIKKIEILPQKQIITPKEIVKLNSLMSQIANIEPEKREQFVEYLSEKGRISETEKNILFEKIGTITNTEEKKDSYTNWVKNNEEEAQKIESYLSQIANIEPDKREQFIEYLSEKGRISEKEKAQLLEKLETISITEEKKDGYTNWINNTITNNSGGSDYPTIGQDGRPYTIEECIEMGIYDKYYDENKSKKPQEVVLIIKETGEVIHDWGTVRVPLGETYTVYALVPYTLGVPTAIPGCVINHSEEAHGTTNGEKNTARTFVDMTSYSKNDSIIHYNINYFELTLQSKKITKGMGDEYFNKEMNELVNEGGNGVIMSATIYYNTDKHSYYPSKGRYSLKAMTNFYTEVYAYELDEFVEKTEHLDSDKRKEILDLYVKERIYTQEEAEKIMEEINDN